MLLSRFDLSQLDEDYLAHLPEERLRSLSAKLLADLKAAHERLDQNPNNSSRPPSSRAPWERADGADARDEPKSSQTPGMRPLMLARRKLSRNRRTMPRAIKVNPTSRFRNNVVRDNARVRPDTGVCSSYPSNKSITTTHRPAPAAARRWR